MKSLAMAGLAIFLSATASRAADMPPVEGGFDWSGAYAGVQLGYAWSENDTTFVEDIFDSITIDLDVGDELDTESDGIFGGGHLGYNFQAGSFVFGLEGALFGTDLEETYINPTDDEFFTTSVDYIATVSGRIGFAFDRALIYAKGGYAGANVSFNFTEPTTTSDDTAEEWLSGFNVGAGVEYAVTDAIVLGVEYTYISLGEEVFEVEDAAGDPLGFESDLDIQTITAKLSYKF